MIPTERGKMSVIRSTPHTARWFAIAALACATFAPSAQASSQLAFDKGCYNCHGNPPKKKAPTFAKLAEDYAKQHSQPGADSQLAEKLRNGSIFSHIDAHERLDADDAQKLVHWLMDGAP